MPASKHSYTVGIITARATDSEQKQVLRGIIKTAQRCGVSVAILSNVYNSSDYFAGVEIENRIYELIRAERLDGLILTAESFLNETLQQRIMQHIRSRAGIPVVVTGTELEGFDCVDSDVRKDAFHQVSHLIEAHGFTKIDFLSGSKDKLTSEERVCGYRDALEKHGIPYDESRVHYGDFWFGSGIGLAKSYINGTLALPEAVACANDYMAYGLCDALLRGGIAIPRDVSVIGYEYVGDRHLHLPVLTTYQRNREELGERAMLMLCRRLTGSVLPMPPMEGRLICGNSCPCGAEDQMLRTELEAVRREQYYSAMNLACNFEQQLTTCHSIADYINVLREFVYLIRNLKGLYLCLRDDWSSSERNAASDLMQCYSVMQPDGKIHEPAFFRKSMLYPDRILPEGDDLILYFCPVFFAGREYGYMILQYTEADSYDVIFRDWLKIASNALEQLRLKNDIHTLIACSNLSSYHDSATGLYNERGIRNELTLAAADASADKHTAVIIIRTGMAFEHIHFGQKQSDVRENAEIAKILKKYAGKHICCAKLSEQLFAVAATGTWNGDEIRMLTDRLETVLTQAALQKKPLADLPILRSAVVNAADFDFDEVVTTLRTEVDEELRILTERQSNPNYAGYAELRAEIWRHPQQEYASAEVCRRFVQSEAYFRNTYKALFLTSFWHDVIQSRISLAKHLLLTSQLSNEAVAEVCGYQDIKYFFRIFKKQTGITPKQYKLAAMEFGKENR